MLLGGPAPYRAPPQLILPRGAPHPSMTNLTEGNQADQAKKRRDYRCRVIDQLFIFSRFETYLLNAPHDRDHSLVDGKLGFNWSPTYPKSACQEEEQCPAYCPTDNLDLIAAKGEGKLPLGQRASSTAMAS